jgi:hypothetical protein
MTRPWWSSLIAELLAHSVPNLRELHFLQRRLSSAEGEALIAAGEAGRAGELAHIIEPCRTGLSEPTE